MRLIIIILAMFGCYTFISAQNGKNDGRLISKIKSEIQIDGLQEFAGDAVSYAENLGNIDSTIVVRICSNQNRYLSLVKSGIHIPSAITVFGGFGFDVNRLIYTLSNDCIVHEGNFFADEIWVLAKGKRMPSYSEQYHSKQISITEISNSNGRYVGSADYIGNTKKLIDELKKNSTAKGVIIGLYRRNKKELNAIKAQVLKVLKKNNIKDTQYYFDSMKINRRQFVDPVKKGKLFPAFYSVIISERKTP
jgi:hypothetical protein